MVSEISEVARFLRKTAPFDALDEETLNPLTRAIEVTYRKAGEIVIEAGTHNDRLFVVRSGAVELKLAGEELTARLAAGACFAYPSLLRGGEVRNTTYAIEDTLLYAVPATHFHALRQSNTAFAAFFAEDEAARLKHALSQQKDARSFSLNKRQIGEVIVGSAPVTCPSDTTIEQAVAMMHVQDVSTLAICDDGALIGIFTDKDLRNRVVAKGVALTMPIAEVMTANPRTLPSHSPIGEAMAVMAGGGFRHLPVLDASGALSGILSATDILAAIGTNAIDAGMMIAKARSDSELVDAAAYIPESFASMVANGVDASHVMRFTSALGEAVHRRAAQLAEAEIGPPPCPYTLVVFGSLARGEQLVGSDQDNGLVLCDSASEADEAYFEQLGTYVSDLLDRCGYVFCKGGIMAKNAEQRLKLADWSARYTSWITNPSEDRILRATIFFDMRSVHGDATLVANMRRDMLARFKDNPLFISYLARDALRSKVPLGIFRNLVLDRGKDGHKTFNAKSQAILPIVDIARTHALAAGIAQVGTHERLSELSAASRMNGDDAQSLEDALEFVNALRIAHQARQIEQGVTPDNLISPDDLSSLERDYLKDALSVIRRGLDALRRNFAGGIA